MHDQIEKTLTEQLHAVIISGNKKWNADHVKAIFKSRRMDNASATGALERAYRLGGITKAQVNSRNHYFKATTIEYDAALKSFLYGFRRQL